MHFSYLRKRIYFISMTNIHDSDYVLPSSSSSGSSSASSSSSSSKSTISSGDENVSPVCKALRKKNDHLPSPRLQKRYRYSVMPTVSHRFTALTLIIVTLL